ncbi:hypothetical protein NEOLEDRAFT_1179811 [Neolentinus lepideus HHB14362 ss-1]|uniref:Ubiquitin 3 binding protein But2 C-terminal domain-containing protein n=1 Tax=Neolentinus lepideus HHB14362 ss-1 TaxID=1314782 RepID=A0A165RHR4_9AGAM|nr:hypothetical protein NEOLEDRAFT_1179811 [Neolentinus lepideus HHB14362 ss-1]
MFQKRTGYKPISQTTDDSSNPDTDSRHSRSLLTPLLIACISLCSLLDVIFVLYLAIHWARSTPAWALNPDDLAFRSTYINFDRLYKNDSLTRNVYPPLVNIPVGVGHVSSTEPQRAFPLWPSYDLVHDGYAPKVERNLLLTSSIRTIAQFRIRDYGMENCSLVLDIPASSPQVYPSQDVEVWELHGGRKINWKSLSWKTMPRRKTQLGTISLSPGVVRQITGLPCSSGSYHTFELSCATVECHVNFTSMAAEATGLYLLQSQTI